MIRRATGHVIQPHPDDAKRIYAKTGAAWKFSSRHYPIPPILDQGQAPECVGYGHHTAALMPPYPAEDSNVPSPHEIYLMARQLDPIDAPEGASVRGGMEALKKLGIIDDYMWLSDLQSIIEAVRDNGPVVAGTPWLNSMEVPDNQGYLNPQHNEPNGDQGHCYTIGGVDQRRGFSGINSWGYSFGLNGRFMMTFATIEFLLSRGGVYALPFKKKSS